MCLKKIGKVCYLFSLHSIIYFKKSQALPAKQIQKVSKYKHTSKKYSTDLTKNKKKLRGEL